MLPLNYHTALIKFIHDKQPLGLQPNTTTQPQNSTIQISASTPTPHTQTIMQTPPQQHGNRHAPDPHNSA